MSEVQSRPAAPRGRGSARGGRGGFSSRGGRGGRGHATNGDKTDNTATTSIEDEGEVGQLKKQYGSRVTTIKEMFPDWTDEDVVFALQETDGDLETTVDRITDGKPLPKTDWRSKPIDYRFMGEDRMLTLLQQVQFHNGEKFPRPRRIDLVLRPKMRRSLHSAIQPANLRSHAAVELDLTVAEEAVVVVQIEAEVEGGVEHRSHTQTVHARRMSRFRLRLLIQLPGIHLPRLAIRMLGILLRLVTAAWIVLSLLKTARVPPRLQLPKQPRRPAPALFQMVLRRAGQASLHLHRRRRRHRNRSLRSMSHPILYTVLLLTPLSRQSS
jgi:hypothetical protein